MIEPTHSPTDRPADLGDRAWADVLQAVDKTYAELIEYQEQLEARNTELLALRKFLASVMGSVSDLLIVAERDGRIADVSASFCDAVDKPVEALADQQIGTFFEGEERARILEVIDKVMASRQPATVEANLSTVSGPDPVEFRVAPRLDRRRKPAGVVLTGRPLGELRRAYSELEESHKELKGAQLQLVRNEKLASLGRLLAGVAHELNNPISFVYANAHALEKYVNRFETYFEQVQAGASRKELVELRESLRLDRDLKNLRTAITGARDGAERVRDIVEDLRRLSSDGAGELTSFDLTDTARVAANWVERGTKHKVGISFEGETKCLAIGRPGHVQQVVMNLIQNAVDASEDEDSPEICVTLSYEGKMAVLRIQDNGPGIPEDVAQQIFDPFFTTKPTGRGTGLGLSISHKIAEEHGGSLELLHDCPAKGACFRLALRSGRDEV
jgi:two-component system sensor histidine kinase HupT/HoxJ